MGRPIDADALKELFSEVIGSIAKKPEMNGNLEHMIRASAMVIQMIDDAPTVQPDTTTHDSIPAKTGKNDGDGTSGDCISRQRAIEAFETAAKSGASIEDIKLILSEMPLVQSSIIRCKDCKYYKYGICMKIGANKSFYGFCDWAERGEQNG